MKRINIPNYEYLIIHLSKMERKSIQPVKDYIMKLRIREHSLIRKITIEKYILVLDVEDDYGN